MSQKVGSDTSSALLDLRDLQLWLLKTFFSILAVALSLVWMSEAWLRHNVNGIDRIAYPLVLLSMTISLVLVQWRPQYYILAVLGTVGVTCVYTVSFLQGIIWGYIPLTDDYNLATFAQWFPMTYILLFLFLSKPQALVISFCIYGSLLIPMGINAYQERALPITEQKFPYLLHLAMSHPIYIAVFIAVSTLQMSFAAARLKAAMADVDHLTNLANRHAATRSLETALATPNSGEQSCVGVILLDVDRFKTINDTYGHGVGDRILIQVAQLIQQTLHPTALAARWGGEEFLVMLPRTNPVELAQTAEGLRSCLATYLHPEVGQVTASFGIAMAIAPQETLEGLIARADQALYQAKDQGRNQVRGGVNDLRVAPLERVD